MNFGRFILGDTLGDILGGILGDTLGDTFDEILKVYKKSTRQRATASKHVLCIN